MVSVAAVAFRFPGLMLRRLLVDARLQDDEAGDHDQPDNNGGISDIEGRVVRELDEVRDLAEAQAVRQVADGPAQLQPQRDAQQPVLQGRKGVVEEDRRDSYDRGHR